jgi:hypothetical protein
MTLTITLALVAATLAALLFIAVGAYRDLAAALRKADALAIEQARRVNAVRAELAEEIGLRRRLGRCVVELQAQLNAGADQFLAAIHEEVDRMEADESIRFTAETWEKVTPTHDGVVLDFFREQLGKPSETWMGWDA